MNTHLQSFKRRIYKEATRWHTTIQVAAVAIALLPITSGATAYAAVNPANCQTKSLSVALGDGLPANQTVVGTLCTPAQWAPGTQTIDVLVHGGSYNRSYWDWPQNPSLYSYVDDTLASGRAVFYYDRIGDGQSSHPLSTDINVVSNAFVLHKILQWTHTTLGYHEVNLIGHSMGSWTAVQEAGTYNDENRVVITGMLHDLTLNPSVPSTFLDTHPAILDAQFAGKPLDPGYLTTVPGTRGNVFYDKAGADPNVIAYDETTKDLMSAVDVTSDLTQDEIPAGVNITNGITAPVLVVVGQEDGLFCGHPLVNPDCTNTQAVHNWEAPYYSAAANFGVVTVPNTGHDLALHLSAKQSFDAINAWLSSH